MTITTTDDRMTSEEIVNLLPEILATAERFDAWAQKHVAFRDLLAQADHVLAGVQMFADDEFEAVAPTLIEGAGQFEESRSPGFVAMGRIMQLQLLVDHPEVVQLAVTRAHQELRQALQHGTLSTRMLRGDAQPIPNEDARVKARAHAYIERTFTADTHEPYGDLAFQFYIAPNCEGDVLTHPPRIKRDTEGMQRLETKNLEGWHDIGVVEHVMQLEPQGLVLVSTDDATYLMTATDFDTPIE